jgi:hypothetical protein
MEAAGADSYGNDRTYRRGLRSTLLFLSELPFCSDHREQGAHRAHLGADHGEFVRDRLSGGGAPHICWSWGASLGCGAAIVAFASLAEVDRPWISSADSAFRRAGVRVHVAGGAVIVALRAVRVGRDVRRQVGATAGGATCTLWLR